MLCRCRGDHASRDTAWVCHADERRKRVAKSVIVVADDPGIDKQPVDCLLARHATMRTCTSTLKPEWTVLSPVLAALAPLKGFEFMNTAGWFCYESQCPIVVGRIIVYRD